MLTTAGLTSSATSANETSDDVATEEAVARVRAESCGAVGAEIAGCGVSEPATTRPIRKATVTARQNVTMANRLFIPVIIALLDQLQQRCLVQHRHAQFLRL